MSPKGDVESRRSKPQPISAPTRTPATNSDERRKPSAIAEARALPSPLPASDWSVLMFRLSRTSDNRCSRLPSLAESAASSEDDLLSSSRSFVPCAMIAKTRTIAENENDPRHPSKAARTILTTLNQVKITSQLLRYLILRRYLAGLQLAESPDHRTATDRCDIADKSVPEPVIRLQHSHDFAAATFANVEIRGPPATIGFRWSFGFGIRLTSPWPAGWRMSNSLTGLHRRFRSVGMTRDSQKLARETACRVRSTITFRFPRRGRISDTNCSAMSSLSTALMSITSRSCWATCFPKPVGCPSSSVIRCGSAIACWNCSAGGTSAV